MPALCSVLRPSSAPLPHCRQGPLRLAPHLGVGVPFQQAGDLVVEAGGELDITQTVNYALPDLSVAAVLSVSVQFLDDQANLTNLSILVSIVPAEAE